MGGSQSGISEEQIFEDIEKINHITNDYLFCKKTGFIITFKLHTMDKSLIQKILKQNLISLSIVK